MSTSPNASDGLPPFQDKKKKNKRERDPDQDEKSRKAFCEKLGQAMIKHQKEERQRKRQNLGPAAATIAPSTTSTPSSSSSNGDSSSSSASEPLVTHPFKCILGVCGQAFTTVEDLHNHYTSFHTADAINSIHRFGCLCGHPLSIATPMDTCKDEKKQTAVVEAPAIVAVAAEEIKPAGPKPVEGILKGDLDLRQECETHFDTDWLTPDAQKAATMLNLTCEICLVIPSKIFTNFSPVYCKLHVVCESCLQKTCDSPPRRFSTDVLKYTAKDQRLCPICQPGAPKGIANFYANDDLTAMIKKLDTCCPLQTRGCTWKGNLSDLVHHIGGKCEKYISHCSHCGDLYYRGDMKAHDTVCPEKDIECTACKKLYERKEERTHQAICPESTHNCVTCHKPIKLKDIDKHYTEAWECEGKEYKCEYECGQMVKMRDLTPHLNDPALAVEHFRVSRKQNLLLVEKLEEARDHFGMVLNKISEATKQGTKVDLGDVKGNSLLGQAARKLGLFVPNSSASRPSTTDEKKQRETHVRRLARRAGLSRPSGRSMGLQPRNLGRRRIEAGPLPFGVISRNPAEDLTEAELGVLVDATQLPARGIPETEFEAAREAVQSILNGAEVELEEDD